MNKNCINCGKPKEPKAIRKDKLCNRCRQIVVDTDGYCAYIDEKIIIKKEGNSCII